MNHNFFTQHGIQIRNVEGQIKDNAADSFGLIHLLDEMQTQKDKRFLASTRLNRD